MSKKLTGEALAKFEAERDIWQEVLDGVREIKEGGGKRKRGKSGSEGAKACSLGREPQEQRPP